MFSSLVDNLEKAANQATNLANIKSFGDNDVLVNLLKPDSKYAIIWERDALFHCVIRWHMRARNNNMGGRQVGHFTCWKEKSNAREVHNLSTTHKPIMMNLFIYFAVYYTQ